MRGAFFLIFLVIIWLFVVYFIISTQLPAPISSLNQHARQNRIRGDNSKQFIDKNERNLPLNLNQSKLPFQKMEVTNQEVELPEGVERLQEEIKKPVFQRLDAPLDVDTVVLPEGVLVPGTKTGEGVTKPIPKDELQNIKKGHPELPFNSQVNPQKEIFDNLHIFYYGWYGNPGTNGKWLHWNHEILPFWGDKNPKATQKYQPPDEIGANFYPLLGPYSSADENIIHQHAQQIAQASIGNVVISWYPPTHSDQQLKDDIGYSDMLIKKLLAIFPLYGVRLSFHIEPYEGRNGQTVREDIKYILKNYDGPGLYKDSTNRPMIFMYDSYHTPASNWATILSPSGSITIRNTPLDATVIALYIDKTSEKLILDGNFDGFYTYFGSVGFTFGSTLENWDGLQQFAKKNGKIFIPSVSPGYEDTRIRPWNGRNSASRREGEYYDTMWEKAIAVKPAHVSITSFNEWHEGSQIEAAKPYQSTTYKYMDYSPLPEDYYLTKTRDWAEIFNARKILKTF